MAELFAIFKQNLLWALLLWVVFFAAFAALFAGRRLMDFAGGVARVLAGIVVSPFIFIRRAVQGVLRFDRTEEEAYRASDQYLLNKAMLVLQALLIVVAIGVLAAGAVGTWNTWVPSSEIRRGAREFAKRVEAQRTTATAANATLATLETEWTQKRDAAVAKFRRDAETRKAAAQKNIVATEQIFATYGTDRGKQTLAEMQQYVTRISMTGDGVREAKQRLDSQLAYGNWGMAGWESPSLRAWVERWETKALAEVALADVPMDVLRAEEQPTYEGARTASEKESANLASMEERQQYLDEAASLKWKAAMWAAVGWFVKFLLFVWTAGVLTEAGWLAIRIADDVRRMREASTPQATDAQAPNAPAPIAPVPGGRLSIRGPAVTETGGFVPPFAGA